MHASHSPRCAPNGLEHHGPSPVLLNERPCLPSPDVPSCRARLPWERRRRGESPLGNGLASNGTSGAKRSRKASHREIRTTTACCCGPGVLLATRLLAEICRGRWVHASGRDRAGSRLGGIRLDLPGAGGRAETGARLLVSLHRSGWHRQPHRPHHHRARRRTIRGRCASRSSVARTPTRARRMPTGG